MTLGHQPRVVPSGACDEDSRTEHVPFRRRTRWRRCRYLDNGVRRDRRIGRRPAVRRTNADQVPWMPRWRDRLNGAERGATTYFRTRLQDLCSCLHRKTAELTPSAAWSHLRDATLQKSEVDTFLLAFRVAVHEVA